MKLTDIARLFEELCLKKPKEKIGKEEEKELEAEMKKWMVHIPVFKSAMVVYCGPPKYFSDVVRIEVSGYNFDLKGGAYRIFLPNTLSEVEKLEWFIRKIYRITKDLTGRRGILDNETEAYIFGYLMKESISKFVDINKVLQEVSIKKELETTNFLPVEVLFTSKRSTYWKGDNHSIPRGAGGSVNYEMGKETFVVIIPPSSDEDIDSHLGTWAHELYHLTRNTFGKWLNDKYLFPEDLLVDYMKMSFPVLKYILWKVGK